MPRSEPSEPSRYAVASMTSPQSSCERASDQARAQSLVQQGNQALAAGETDKLRDIVEKLWKLLPASAEQRRQGYDSGVR